MNQRKIYKKIQKKFAFDATRTYYFFLKHLLQLYNFKIVSSSLLIKNKFISHRQ